MKLQGEIEIASDFEDIKLLVNLTDKIRELESRIKHLEETIYQHRLELDIIATKVRR